VTAIVLYNSPPESMLLLKIYTFKGMPSQKGIVVEVENIDKVFRGLALI
jgi:hypothetical protein